MDQNMKEDDLKMARTGAITVAPSISSCSSFPTSKATASTETADLASPLFTLHRWSERSLRKSTPWSEDLGSAQNQRVVIVFFFLMFFKDFSSMFIHFQGFSGRVEAVSRPRTLLEA